MHSFVGPVFAVQKSSSAQAEYNSPFVCLLRNVTSEHKAAAIHAVRPSTALFPPLQHVKKSYMQVQTK